MDIALAIDNILPAAEYYGSVTANTEEAWNAATWTDPRVPKPTWAELETAWADYTAQEAATQRLAAIDARLAEIDTASNGPEVHCDRAFQGIRTYRRKRDKISLKTCKNQYRRQKESPLKNHGLSILQKVEKIGRSHSHFA